VEQAQAVVLLRAFEVIQDEPGTAVAAETANSPAA
jgi:hypothetical protein